MKSPRARFRLLGLGVALAFTAGSLRAAPEQTALFAGGCFWCMEKPFEQLDGVGEVVSGYAGGHVDNPTYEQVSAGGTGHREVVRVSYDPEKVTYEKLLKVFWPNIDPFDADGQFCDRGSQYAAAIFVATPAEREAAEKSRREIQERLGKPVATEILAAKEFYPAEGYHQDYYKTHSLKYRFYRWNCGRDQRLEEVWGES